MIENMKFNKEQTQNYVTLVGSIKEIDLADTENKGNPVVRGSLMVEAGDSVFKVDFYEGKSWGYGKDNQRQNPKYSALKGFSEGQMVNLSCAIEGNKFKGNDGTIVNNQRLNLAFINDVRQTDTPKLEFDIVGVVLRPLHEVRDKEDNLLHYSIKLGQAQYRVERGYSTITLDVEANNTNAVNHIRDNYLLNNTVRVSGRGVAVIETRKEEIPSDFGAPVVREFQNHRTNYFIESGLQPSESSIYKDEQLEFLTQATKSFDESLMAEKPKTQSQASAPAANKGGVAGMLGLQPKE